MLPPVMEKQQNNKSRNSLNIAVDLDASVPGTGTAACPSTNKQVELASLLRLLRYLYLAAIPLPRPMLKQTFLTPCPDDASRVYDRTEPVLALGLVSKLGGVSPRNYQDNTKPPQAWDCLARMGDTRARPWQTSEPAGGFSVLVRSSPSHGFLR